MAEPRMRVWHGTVAVTNNSLSFLSCIFNYSANPLVDVTEYFLYSFWCFWVIKALGVDYSDIFFADVIPY